MAGIRILDFSLGGAGPFATKALADHGAEVIKVETSTHLRFSAHHGALCRQAEGASTAAPISATAIPSKLGVTLNLKTKDAVEIAKRPDPDLRHHRQ